jgi:uncharacterized membrane protein
MRQGIGAPVPFLHLACARLNVNGCLSSIRIEVARLKNSNGRTSGCRHGNALHAARPEQGRRGRILPICAALPVRRLLVPSHGHSRIAPVRRIQPFSGRNIAVAARADPRQARPIHPLYAFLLAAAVPLFLGGLLSDLAYGATAEIQWSNFAAWLIAGAMVFTGFALLWSFIALLRARGGRRWPLVGFVLLLAAFAIGLIDSFVHARDAWAVMPAAPILSAIVTLIAVVAAWWGFSTLRPGEPK